MEAIPQDPRLKSIYPAYRLDSQFFRLGAQLGITAEFDDPDGQVWQLVQSLDGRPLSEVVHQMRSRFPTLSETDVLEGVRTLDGEGFLESTQPHGARDDQVEARYLPNVRYFSHFAGLTGDRFAPHARLRGAHVLVLGLGGGGSNILTLLAGAGVGTITGVDYDIVEDGNLGRQFLYRPADIGRHKAQVAAEAMAAMNPECTFNAVVERIDCSDDVAALLPGVDLVVCALDEPPFLAQRRVNTACIPAAVPCVYGVSQVTRGRVFSVLPHESGCFDCMNVHYSQKDPLFVKQFQGFQSSRFHSPALAYAPAMFALTAVMADEAVRLLTGYTPPRSVGTQFEIDYISGSGYPLLSWPRMADDCPTCGTGIESDWEIFAQYQADPVTADR
jgi:molybdopterin/thiamine biosynthesis adenylyltransferase